MMERIEFEDYQDLIKWFRMFDNEPITRSVLPDVPYSYGDLLREIMRRDNQADALESE